MTAFEFRNALEAFAKIDTAMPMSALQTLVWVGINDGTHQHELEEYLGTSNATTSRAIAWWADWKSFKDKVRGPGFIDSYPDPMNRRYRILKLTTQGRAFFEEVFGRKPNE